MAIFELDKLMQKEVSRADFLRYIGVALLGMVGITNFLKALQGASTHKSSRKISTGYGGTVYGR